MNTMGIKLVFAYNREVLQFLIKNMEVFYTDRKWLNKWIRFIPKDKDFVKKNPRLAHLFELSPEELKEYSGAKTNEDLALLIVRDAKSKGLVLRKVLEN